MSTPVAVPEKPTIEKEEGGRPAYTRVGVTGLLLVASAPAVGFTAALLSGMELGEDGIFFGLMILVPLIGAALAWRFGLWSKVVGAVLSAAAGLMLFWMVFGLAYPASFADFVPGILLPLGVILGLVGNISAIVAHRRGHRLVVATPGERRILLIAGAVVLLAVLGSGAASLLGRTTAGAVTGATPVTISEFEFAEGTYEVDAGEATTLLVHNSDPFVHTFTIPELDIDETVLPGSDVAVTLTAPAGTYTLYCKPHSNLDEPDPAEAGMAGTVIAR